jgi:hypothetical protein
MKMGRLNKIIKAKCLDCCCDETMEVKFCSVYTCPLWYYRLGTSPEQKRNINNMLLNQHIMKDKFSGLSAKDCEKQYRLIRQNTT